MTVDIPISYHTQISINLFMLEYTKLISNLVLVYYVMSMARNFFMLFCLNIITSVLTIRHMNTNKDFFWAKIMKRSTNYFEVIKSKMRQSFLKNLYVRLFLLFLYLLFLCLLPLHLLSLYLFLLFFLSLKVKSWN